MSSRHYEWNLGEPLPLLGEHSVAKHEIFEQYVGVYIERLTRTPSQDVKPNRRRWILRWWPLSTGG
jgi:hypothetical protein